MSKQVFVKENRGSFSTCLGKIRFFGKPTHALTVWVRVLISSRRAWMALQGVIECLTFSRLLYAFVEQRVDFAWSGRWHGVCTHAREFHRQSNGKEKPTRMTSDEDTIRIDISRNSSRHMSCSRLREQQEREEQDGTQSIAYAKRKLDAM